MPRDAQNVLIYGANGFTALLAVDLALAGDKKAWFKSRLVLAGRSKNKIEPIANKRSLPYRIFSLLDAAHIIDEALKDVRVVLHMAGPFIHTAEPMLEACIRNKCDYLDITGEQLVFENVFVKHAAELLHAGIIALPGSGFDIVPTGCIAAKLVQALPSATHLNLAFSASKGSTLRPSAGTALTAFEIMTNRSNSAYARINGAMVDVGIAYKQCTAKFATLGTTNVSFLPMGDCYAAYYHTKIPNIDTFIPLPYVIGLATYYSTPIVKLLVNYIPLLGTAIRKGIAAFISGPNEKTRWESSIDVWGEVRDEYTGDIASLSMVVKEGYSLTALVSMEAARRIYERDTQQDAGAASPSMLFGSTFIDQFALHQGQVIFEKRNIKNAYANDN